MTMTHGEPIAASPDYVQSLARGLSVIKAFDAEHPRRTLSEVAKATDLTRATARRFLLTLVELGYVRTDGSQFWLTPRVLELGYSYLSSLTLPDVARPHLEALAQKVHESTSVSVLDGGDVVYVARVPVSRIMTVSITIGTRFPAHATSMGRVLLAGLSPAGLDAYLATATLEPLTSRTLVTPADLRAELDRIRRDGYCIVDQELEEGLRSLAAPIRDASGAVVAAVNISTQAARYSLDAVHSDLVPAVVDTAAAISSDLARTQNH
ncbi:IclR family transcriptional regulator [Rhodococcus ruber]|uniref:Glycerol operon regulatory protein n=2 Tax=Nocardiaceae TaxID=85025 RepID=A0A098BJN0_9NOCA|nr:MULTISPECIES: IclR family transcriptional regulator [Rhodococcus]MCD2128328.1 IclR family transcriptional regulator [Rhodococcus ruber]MCZ1071823.1 IclR family transcriptional regulator [Rhodococcus sp. A5(2022)]MCZ4505038.1 IclR family transcriptional regulator [Rhodococcus ruber]MCZ4531741.1 IclR family transcriptional regulator [Rhodococcus ruber]MCZ4622541.1 IclR family transcriptional regulator [Rhodococcus ruber]